MLFVESQNLRGDELMINNENLMELNKKKKFLTESGRRCTRQHCFTRWALILIQVRAVSVPLLFELGTSFCDWKKLYALRRDQFEDENVCWTWREIGGWFELRKNRNLHVKICMYKNMKAIHITGLKVVGIFGALTPWWRHNGPKRRPCWLTDIPLPKLVLYYKVCGPH